MKSKCNCTKERRQVFNLLAPELHLPSQLPGQAQLAEQTGMHLCSQVFPLRTEARCFRSAQATQRMCPKLLHLPPKSLSYSKYIRHYLNCLSLSPWHAKNLLRFWQGYFTKSSLTKVVKGGKSSKGVKETFPFPLLIHRIYLRLTREK